MRYGTRLSRQQYEAVVRGQDGAFRSWPGPVYGLDTSWTGARAAGAVEVVDGVPEFIGLSHGELLGAGPRVEVAVTVGDPVELARRLDRGRRPRGPGTRPPRPEPGVGGVVETTVPVDGEPVRALRWPTATGWAAAVTRGDLRLAVAARQVDPDAVRLVRVDLEPYLAGRHAQLLRAYDEAQS